MSNLLLDRIRYAIGYSPSRQMDEIGKSMADGFKRGIEDARKEQVPEDLICGHEGFDSQCSVCEKRMEYYMPRLEKIARRVARLYPWWLVED